MNDSSYLESKILTTLNELDRLYSDHWEIQEKQSLLGNMLYRAEDEWELKGAFKRVAAQIIIECKAYFEMQGLHSLLRDFTLEAKSFLMNDSALLSGELDPEGFAEHSKFTGFVWSYMSCFEFMKTGVIERLAKSAGVSILENILRATPHILEQQKVTPDNETTISRTVKLFVKVAFESAQFPQFSFLKTAQEYIPDILVPGLKAAIEYKYAKTEKALSKTVEQILIDVEGYDNHPDYILFYAVFYVKTGVCTEARFFQIWEEKHFPKNWKPIFVHGR